MRTYYGNDRTEILRETYISQMHLLIIEDNATLAEALCLHFQDGGHTVTYVQDGEQGLQFLRQEYFDCCLLDINLPYLSGLVVLRTARQAGIQTPVLMLTARDEVADRVAGLDAGADDYLTKPFDLQELEARVRALLRRRPDLQEKISHIGRLQIHHDGQYIAHENNNLRLTAKEFKAFETMFNNRSQLVTKSNLISQVYGVGADINEASVEVLVSRLRKKILPHGVSVKTVRGLGYYLQEENR